MPGDVLLGEINNEINIIDELKLNNIDVDLLVGDKSVIEEMNLIKLLDKDHFIKRYGLQLAIVALLQTLEHGNDFKNDEEKSKQLLKTEII